jgi:hypothetical protein
MKLPPIWRPRQMPEAQETPQALTSPPTIDVSSPRECWYQTFAGHPSPCPRCGTPLHQSYQMYMIATRRGPKLADSFVTGSDFGWFCRNCPTVVINPRDVSALLQHSLPHWDVGSTFAVLGIDRVAGQAGIALDREPGPGVGLLDEQRVGPLPAHVPGSAVGARRFTHAATRRRARTGEPR